MQPSSVSPQPLPSVSSSPGGLGGGGGGSGGSIDVGDGGSRVDGSSSSPSSPSSSRMSQGAVACGQLQTLHIWNIYIPCYSKLNISSAFHLIYILS